MDSLNEILEKILKKDAANIEAKMKLDEIKKMIDETEVKGVNVKDEEKPKKGKLIVKYVNQRVEHKKTYQQQLDRLDSQLEQENIDKIERDRFITILEAKYYEQQHEDWDKFENSIK